MFTGIIEEVGEIKSVSHSSVGAVISIKAKKVIDGTKIGDSIAVNGICLTVAKLRSDGFDADVTGETMRRSSLKASSPGRRVNLERAMSADGRFGGHIVSGHIDCEGVIKGFEKEDNAVWLTVWAEPVMKYIVEKGSVAVDGVSLTVAAVSENTFSVSVIPHTGRETALFSKKIGDSVNIEADIVGKYIEKFINFQKPQTLTADFLAENGFI